MKWYWKALIGLSSLVLLIILLNIGLNIWVNSQLPKIINRENDSAYEITYKELTVSLWERNIRAHDIIVIPKNALGDTLNKIGIYARIKALEIKDFQIKDVLFNDKIKARSIVISQPKVMLYTKNKKENIRESVVAPFDKIISVSDVFLNDGDFKIMEPKSNREVLRMHNINLQLDGILITEDILKKKLPFEYSDYKLSCDSLYFHPNPFYHIRAQKIKGSKTDFHLDSFEMIPAFSRGDFVAKMPKEKDIFTLFCKAIRVSKIDWGFKKDDFFFHCNALDLNQVTANIYRSRRPVADLSKKHLYNKLLRDLSFDLKIDTLKVRNSFLEYEEEKLAEAGPGKLSFSRFNLSATNISSGFKKKSLPGLKIKINCRFMKASPLAVNWKLNVLDKNDGFQIKGTLTHFNTQNMTPFIKPYMNVTTKGVLDQVHFNFTGNDQRSSGEFAVEYDDLKFTVYKKNDRKKENKLKTFFAKIFVKKDTEEKIKNAHVEVERIPHKSFYNLLWRSIQDGLMQILLGKKVGKS